MRGVTIYDRKNNVLAFSLIDILKIIGEKAFLSMWKISNVECVGENSEKLHHISDEGIRISGEEIFSLSSNILQIIDGDFEAYWENEDLPWLIIKAIDGSEYDVESDDKNIIAKMKGSFSKVTDLPNY
jgi:hypothetical protein